MNTPKVSGQRTEVRDQKSEVRNVLALISDTAFAAIRSHLTQAYPIEGCGVLIGRETDSGTIEISRALGTRNAETQRGADRFTIDPRDLLAIERELDVHGGVERVIGFFHSHPDAPALPSQTDLKMAQGLFDVARAYYVYAIAKVSRDGMGELTLWRLADDLESFVELNWTAE